MSESVYFSFMSNNMLIVELEQDHKDDMITLTEQLVAVNGIGCDSKISKISEGQLREINDGVGGLRKRREKKMGRTNSKKRRA